MSDQTKKPIFDPSKPFDVAKKPPFDPNAKTEPVSSLEQIPTQDRAAFLKYAEEQLSPSNIVRTIGEGYDKYSGAPLRSAAEALLNKEGLPGAFKAYKEQLGADPKLAPTGKELVKRIGFPDQNPPAFSWAPTPATVAGTATDLVLDTGNIIPLAQGAKATYGAAKGIGKVGLKGLEMTAPIAPGIADAASMAMHAGGAVEDSVKTFMKGLSPRIAEDYATALDIAARHSIPQEALSDAIKYGDSSLISKIGRKRAQGPGGEDLLKRHQWGLQEIEKALDNFNTNTIGKGMPPLSRQDAGELIKDSWNNAVQKFFDSRDVTYSNVMDNLPATSLTEDAAHNVMEKLGEIHQSLAEKRRPGGQPLDKAQANMIEERLNYIADIIQGGTYKDLTDELRQIGKTAFTFKNQSVAGYIPEDIKINRDLYNTIKDAIFDTVDTVGGPEVGAALRKNNEEFAKFFKNNSLIEKELLSDSKSPEKLYASLIESGDSKKLNALKEILGPDSAEMSQIKASFIDNVKRTNKLEAMSFADMGGKLRNNRNVESVLRNLFNPEEVQGISELVLLGEHQGPAILNTSASGEFMNFSDMGKAISSDSKESAMVDFLKRRAERNTPKPGPGGAAQQVAGSRFTMRPDESKKTFTIPEKLKNILGDYAKDLKPTAGQGLRQVPKVMSERPYNEFDAMTRRMVSERQRARENKNKKGKK